MLNATTCVKDQNLIVICQSIARDAVDMAWEACDTSAMLSEWRHTQDGDPPYVQRKVLCRCCVIG